MPSSIVAILSSLFLLLSTTPPTLASTSSLHLIPRGDIALIPPPVPLKHDLGTQRRKKDRLRTSSKEANKRPSFSTLATLETGHGHLALPSGVKHKSIWSILFAAAAVEDQHLTEDETEEEEVEDDFEEEGDGGDMLGLEEWSRRKRATSVKGKAEPGEGRIGRGA
ncbi:hypothetical protein RTBOTA2_002456 [Rhodotorula toruloides]|nr:hypothetical protein RTBOTA2_002456 [Rhodotorula toruloides]